MALLVSNNNFIGPKNKTDGITALTCCCVCRLRSSTVQCSRYPKTVDWHTFKIGCPSPRLCMSAPPIHHITLAGAGTLDKAVGTCVSTLPYCSTPSAEEFKDSGNHHLIVCAKFSGWSETDDSVVILFLAGHKQYSHPSEHERQRSFTVGLFVSCYHVMVWAFSFWMNAQSA